MGPADLWRLAVLADVVRDGDMTEQLRKLAKAHKVDVAAIEKAVKAELTPRPKEDAAKKPASGSAAKKASATKGGAKKKGGKQ